MQMNDLSKVHACEAADAAQAPGVPGDEDFKEGDPCDGM